MTVVETWTITEHWKQVKWAAITPWLHTRDEIICTMLNGSNPLFLFWFMCWVERHNILLCIMLRLPNTSTWSKTAMFAATAFAELGKPDQEWIDSCILHRGLKFLNKSLFACSLPSGKVPITYWATCQKQRMTIKLQKMSSTLCFSVFFWLSSCGLHKLKHICNMLVSLLNITAV